MASIDQPGGQALRTPLDEATAGLWAIAALGRLAESGTLTRLSERAQPLEDPVELADARLLAAFGLLEPANGGFRVPADLADGPALTAAAASAFSRTHLMQAIAHTRGQPAGWQTGDGAVLLAQGRASAHFAAVIDERLLPRMPEARAALESGRGSFLDVGVGVAALSISVAERFPGTRAVGLDVLPAALDIARTQIAVAGLRDAVELRLESVADLTDEAAFDLAWVPQMFIPPAALDAGLGRVRSALRPGGWVILALPGHDDADDGGHVTAYQSLFATTLGGGPMSVEQGRALLARHRYLDGGVARAPQPLLLAQRGS
ncbi:MAG TPA: class I SAM-dependent methyltransferase [Solirubrobacteraceae bacterium]